MTRSNKKQRGRNRKKEKGQIAAQQKGAQQQEAAEKAAVLQLWLQRAQLIPFLGLRLQKEDKRYHQQAQIIVQDCNERNVRQEPGYENKYEPMLRRLKELVGDRYWKKTNDDFIHWLQEKKGPAAATAFTAAVSASASATAIAISTAPTAPTPAEKTVVVQRSQIDEAQIQQAVLIIKDCKERNKRLNHGHDTETYDFIMFTHVLIWYLGWAENCLREQARIIILNIDKRNKQQEPGYVIVNAPMQRRLKELVGDQHWKKAHDYLAAAVSKISSEIHSAPPATTEVVVSSPSLSSASLAAANSSTATTNAVQVCYHGSSANHMFTPGSGYFQLVNSYVVLRQKYAGTDDTVLHEAKTKFFRDTDNRNVLLDPNFVKYIFASAVLVYSTLSSEEKERYLNLSMRQRILTASYELEKILDLGILVKYFVIPDANKEIIDYEKLYRYNREIDSERGIIRCLFRETHAHCDCMQTKKLEAQTMDKMEQCQGCGKYDYHHKMKTCTGCYCVVYCHVQCAKEDWPRHQSVCNKIRQKKRHACSTTKMDDNNNGNVAARSDRN